MNILQNFIGYIQDLINFFTKGNKMSPITNPILSPEDKLIKIILNYNSEYISYYPALSTTINAQIHKIDEITAKKMANLIFINATKYGLDPIYLSACINQESRHDPECYNHNLSITNPTISFPHTDFSCCQFSGLYLPSKEGMNGLTEQEMKEKSFTPEWSVPMMASVMAGNLVLAQKYLSEDEKLRTNTHNLNNTNLTDTQFLATLFYNRGAADDEVNKKGGRYYVKNLIMDKLAHPFRVGNWFKLFNIAFDGNEINFVKGLSLGYNEYFTDHESR